MSDYLDNLAGRSIGAIAIRPRLPSRFEEGNSAAQPLEVDSDVTVQFPEPRVSAVEPRSHSVPRQTPPSVGAPTDHPVQRTPPIRQPMSELPIESFELPAPGPSIVTNQMSAATDEQGPLLRPAVVRLATEDTKSLDVQARASSPQRQASDHSIQIHRSNEVRPESLERRITSPTLAQPQVLPVAATVARPATVELPQREIAARVEDGFSEDMSAPPSPVIQVTIGRIEVRAVTSQPTMRTKTAAARPTVSLEEYLNRRGGSEK